MDLIGDVRSPKNRLQRTSMPQFPDANQCNDLFISILILRLTFCLHSFLPVSSVSPPLLPCPLSVLGDSIYVGWCCQDGSLRSLTAFSDWHLSTLGYSMLFPYRPVCPSLRWLVHDVSEPNHVNDHYSVPHFFPFFTRCQCTRYNLFFQSYISANQQYIIIMTIARLLLIYHTYFPGPAALSQVSTTYTEMKFCSMDSEFLSTKRMLHYVFVCLFGWVFFPRRGSHQGHLKTHLSSTAAAPANRVAGAAV